jgi:hypothetical protein
MKLAASRAELAVCFLIVSYLAYSSTPKMEAMFFRNIG